MVSSPALIAPFNFSGSSQYFAMGCSLLTYQWLWSCHAKHMSSSGHLCFMDHNCDVPGSSPLNIISFFYLHPT